MEIGTESTGAVMDIRLSGKPNQTNPNHTGLPTMDEILKTTWNSLNGTMTIPRSN